LKPELRRYQLDAQDAIETAQRAGNNRVLVQMPTGTGKTVMFAALLKRFAGWLATLPPAGAKLLVIAHREELLDQAVDKIQKANPGLIVTVEQGSRHSHKFSDVIVASIQTLSASKFKRLHQLLARHTFRIVIVDEAHHAAASTYRTALAHLGFLPPADLSEKVNVESATEDEAVKMTAALDGWDAVAPKDRLLIGVTATPNRSDAVGLGCVFQTLAYSYRLKQAISDKWLVPLTPWIIETHTSLENVQLSHGDFNQRQLADAVNNERRNQLAVAAWQEYAQGRATLAFTVDVQHAKDLAGAFTQAGVRAAYVSGETPKDERHATLQQFRDGQLDVITNCMVLTEGTDLPIASCILHAKPTKSATLYEQMTGRGLRLYDGKDDCVVIDLVDVARRHSLQSAPVLYGLPPQLTVKGKRLDKVADEFEELLALHKGFDASQFGRVTLEQLQAHASKFNVWEVPELGAFGAGRAMTWVKVGTDRFSLSFPWLDGEETLVVTPDLLGKWELSATFKSKETGEKRQRTIGTGFESSDVAAGVAEQFVLQERQTVTKLVSKNEPWRVKLASEKQINYLRRLRVPVKHGLTAGEASNLIDLATAKR
jgi:superfamily II DNA or RNA helicase